MWWSKRSRWRDGGTNICRHKRRRRLNGKRRPERKRAHLLRHARRAVGVEDKIQTRIVNAEKWGPLPPPARDREFRIDLEYVFDEFRRPLALAQMYETHYHDPQGWQGARILMRRLFGPGNRLR